MAQVQRNMECEMRQLEDAEKDAEREIEQEWRRQHWGHEPERPAAWNVADGETQHARGEAERSPRVGVRVPRAR